MLVASRFSVPVAVVPWPELRGRITAVVKLSYEVRADGAVVIAARPDPLTPDNATPAGVVLFPSDFARSKSQCDVLLVGRAITLPAARTRLSVLGVTKVVEHAAALGPIAVSSSHVQRVQYAPTDQRVAHPRLPFRLRYERDGLVLDAIIPGPTPQVGYVRNGRIELQHPAIDTIAIDPERRRVMVSLRALIDGVDVDGGGLLVVDDLARLTPSSSEAFSWQRSEAAVAAAPVSAGPRSRPMIDDEEATTCGDEPSPDAAALEESTITISERGQPQERPLARTQPFARTQPHLARWKAATLPFQKVAAIDKVRPSVDAPARVTPREAARTVAAARIPSGSSVGFDLAPFAAVQPLAGTPQPLETWPSRSPELSIEAFAAIKAELWAGTEPRRAVLRRHALSELKWRVLERAFALQSQKSGDPRLLALLRSEAGRQEERKQQASAMPGHAAPHAGDAHAPTEHEDVENADTSEAEAVR